MTDFFDDLYRKGWRELGFYYEYDEKSMAWTFIGDQSGLSRFAEILKEYASDSSKAPLSEHKHLGPQEYFKIITWNTPFIANDGVYGSIGDLIRLAVIFTRKLSAGKNFTLDSDYSKANKSKINVIVKKKGFDPASLDDSIKT